MLASPVRRWLGQDPVKILSPYIREGMTVLEPGPGMGFFTIPMARMVGAKGRVIAVDVQPKMIGNLKCRAAKSNLRERIDARVAPVETLGVEDLKGKVDFALAFAVVHEFPDALHLFHELSRALKPGGNLLLAEPRGHVSESDLARELDAAAAAGLTAVSRPDIPRSRSVYLRKG